MSTSITTPSQKVERNGKINCTPIGEEGMKAAMAKLNQRLLNAGMVKKT